nr:PREDICTED: uncharacterized protein LOC109040821 [Bemisia tabaci]
MNETRVTTGADVAGAGEKARKVASPEREREWLHSQGCGLCGCPCPALGCGGVAFAPALAPARLLSDARVALRALPLETQRSSPPWLSAADKDDPDSSASLSIPKTNRQALRALLRILGPRNAPPQFASRRSPVDGEYSIECGPEPGAALLRTRARIRVARIVLADLFVDPYVSDCVFDSRCLDATVRVCEEIFGRLSPAAVAEGVPTRGRPALLLEPRLTNEPRSNTDLNPSELGESPFARSDIRGGKLPQSIYACDIEPSSFNFLENPILSDGFKSFLVNCINDDKTPFCDQLFFRLLFYLNVIGLNLLSRFGEFARERNDALPWKLTKEVTNDYNFNNIPVYRDCYQDRASPLEKNDSPATSENKTPQRESEGCPSLEDDILRNQNFPRKEKSQSVVQEEKKERVNPKPEYDDARVRESDPFPTLIDSNCDQLVERGCEINHSEAQSLDFIRDLIPCYEQLSRTDEALRGQIEAEPHCVAPQLEASPQAHQTTGRLNFNFEPNSPQASRDLGGLSPPRGEDFEWWNQTEGRWNSRVYMNAMRQKSPPDAGREDGSAAGAEKVLKSALKRGAKKSGHRVKFDESLNKFFDADYVILVREDSEFEDRFGEVCECGDEFCDGRYYEDEESDDDDFILSNCPCPHGHDDGCGDHNQGSNRFRPNSRMGPGYEFPIPGPGPGGCGSTFEPPLEFVDVEQDVTLSPPDGYKDGCCSHRFPESSEPVIHAHLNAHQKFERDQDSVGSISSTINQESKASETHVRSLQSNNEASELHREEEPNFRNEEQEKPNFVPETTSSKFSNLYSQGKLSPNSLERNLGLKLRTLNSSQSLKPNSAVRQLFPSSNFILPPQFAQKSPDLEEASLGNSYARFVPNSSLFHTYTSIENDEDDDDDGLLGNNLFKKTIEKNSLRRSLIRYPKDYRKRKCKRIGSENSLTERIKKLTCDIDDEENAVSNQNEPEQSKSQLQEENENRQTQQTQPLYSNEVTTILSPERAEKVEKPMMTTQSSSTSSTMSSTYKKLTDLFSRKSEKCDTNSAAGTRNTDQHHHSLYRPVYQTAPDLGNGLNISNKYPVTKGSTEARKQFLSSLAPLTACVSGNFEPSSPHGPLSLNLSGNRNSVASVDSNMSSEYSVNDIDEALGRARTEPPKLAPQPDVIAGTPAGNSDAGNNDELALFVQQDAGRIERIKNRYTGSTNGDSDEDNDDYGFHRRPSVRGIKPRFGSTTEIIQQIQSQLQPPAALNPANIGSHMTWPYYTVEQKSFVTSDTSNTLITTDTAYSRNHPNKLITSTESSPEGMINQSIPYANRYSARASNIMYQQDLLATSRDCPIYRNQRMVQMHLSPLPASQQVRFSAPGPQFKHEVSSHYLVQAPQSGITSIIHVEQGQQQTIRVPYPTSGPVQVHLQTSRRSESPILQNQHSISVRSTQTSAMPYYDPKPPPPYYNYGPLVYVDHTRPGLPPNNCVNSNLGSPLSSVTSSPTKSKPETSLCAERGVPEGAASVPLNYQQDPLYSVPVPPMSQETLITLTPTSQPNSSVYYAMNV